MSPQLAYNSLTVEGALALVTVVKNTPKTALEEINISVSVVVLFLMYRSVLVPAFELNILCLCVECVGE